MKTYSASDLGSHKRTEVFEAAKEGGVIIQKRNTNGKPLMDKFVMIQIDSPARRHLDEDDDDPDLVKFREYFLQLLK